MLKPQETDTFLTWQFLRVVKYHWNTQEDTEPKEPWSNRARG